MKPKGKSHNFSKIELSSYFKNLASTNQSEHRNEPENAEPENIINLVKDIDDILNRNFNLHEVKAMIAKLKDKKAAGIDTMISELLKNLDEPTLNINVKIMNKIFDTGEFPEEWAVGIIVILFKGGEKNDINNYCGITLLSVIGKLLVGMLNKRLTKFVEKHKIVHENQAGFRKGYRTTDHIFTLYSVIHHTINVKKKPLYVCFIDFKKAFDKVSHALLWQKLVNYGIDGKFINIIKSMYSKVKSCVRSNDGLTEFFPYNKGLRQGCLLSPLLFALFLIDLNNFLLKESSGITIWDIQICAMLYADDLILLAESEQDLQTQMNSLGTYADIFQMEVNQKKTKVLIFDKPAKLKKRASKTLSIGNINIEEDKIYKYLGVVFTSKGSFIEHVNTLKEKANKAYYSIVARSKEWQGFNPKTFFHIFDHTILPILNYGAEIWGGKEWIELEKLHLSAYKYILGVSHSTPTNGIYAELGRHPLQISRKIAIVKYLKRLTELSEDLGFYGTFYIG